MQCYRIHPDPAVNARLLPKSMLLTNVREGVQILSDIGHSVGVTWDNQYKPYNPNHPLTRSFAIVTTFYNFFRVLDSCCEEAIKRGYNVARFIETLPKHETRMRILHALPRTEEESYRRYILARKAKLLTQEERYRLLCM